MFGGIENGVMVLNDYGCMVRDEWLNTSETPAQIQRGEFVVMPNHFHGIVIIAESVVRESSQQSCQQRRQMALSKIIGRFKMLTAKRINIIRQLAGVPVWQRNYYEHVIRNEADYGKIAEYIADNPRRWEEDALHPNRIG